MKASKSTRPQATLSGLLSNYVGANAAYISRASPQGHFGGRKIYLKREDRNHTGAHKIKHCMPDPVAGRMGRPHHRETRRGPAWLATPRWRPARSSVYGLYGEVDYSSARSPTVFRHESAGAEVRGFPQSSRTRKDAMNER